jgi:hypothetical protein
MEPVACNDCDGAMRELERQPGIGLMRYGSCPSCGALLMTFRTPCASEYAPRPNSDNDTPPRLSRGVWNTPPMIDIRKKMPGDDIPDFRIDLSRPDLTDSTIEDFIGSD